MDLSSIATEAVKTFETAIERLNGSGGLHLTPAAALTIDGKPFGTLALSRIISISLTDKRGFEADELTIELDDHDGAIAIPKTSSKITLHLGFKETGLVDKGEYLFSEFTASGSPDTLSITARAADLAETIMQQKERSWHKQTLFQIVEKIAKEHGLEARISEAYKLVDIAHIDQTNESDASFLTRLAEQNDAIATVKAGRLLFIPAGESQTASGQPIAETHIKRSSGDRHSFTFSATNAYNAVRAYYTDKATGKKKEVVVSKDNLIAEKRTEPVKRKRRRRRSSKRKTPATSTVQINRRVDTAGLKIKTLRHLYASEKTAWHGARAAFRRLARGVAQFGITLATGRPDLCPETHAAVSGFKPEIDAESWLITEVQHQLSSSGYTCALKLEAQLKLDDEEEGSDKAKKNTGKGTQSDKQHHKSEGKKTKAT